METDTGRKKVATIFVVLAVSISSLIILIPASEMAVAETGDIALAYSDGAGSLRWNSLLPGTVNATANNSIVLTNANPDRHYTTFNMTIHDLQGDPNNLPMTGNYFVDVFEDDIFVGQFGSVDRYVNFSASLTSTNTIKIVPTIKWVHEFCIGDFTGTFSITAFNDTPVQSMGTADLSVESAPSLRISYGAGQTKLAYGANTVNEGQARSIDMLITNMGNDELNRVEFLVEDLTNDSNSIETFGNIEIQVSDDSHNWSWWYYQEPMVISLGYNLRPSCFVKVRFRLNSLDANSGLYGGTFTVKGYTPAGIGTNIETGYQEIAVDSDKVVMEMDYTTGPHPLQVLFGEDGHDHSGGGLVKYEGDFSEIDGGDASHVSDISWHPSGAYAASVGGYGPLKKYDGTTVSTYSMPGTFYSYGIDWNPDGSYALIVGENGTVLKYDGSSFTTLLTGMTDTFTCVAWHPSGDHAFLGTTTGKVIDYDDQSNTFSEVYASGEHIADIEWKPGGSVCLAVGSNGLVLKYDANGFITLNSGVALDHNGIDWRPDGSYAIIGTTGHILKYDGVAFSLLHTDASEDYVDVSFSPNGDSAFIAERNGRIFRYDGSSIVLVHTHTWGLRCVEYSPQPVHDTSMRFGSVTPGSANVEAENWFVVKNSGNVDIVEFSMYFMDLNFTDTNSTYFIPIGGNSKIVSENGTEYPVSENGYVNFTFTLRPGENIGYRLIITDIPSTQRPGTYTGVYSITGTQGVGTRATSTDSDTLIGTIGTPLSYTYPPLYPYPYLIPPPGTLIVEYSDGASNLSFASPLEVGKKAENILVISNGNVYPVRSLSITFQNTSFRVYAKDQDNNTYHPDQLGSIYINKNLGVGHNLIMRFFIESILDSYSPYIDHSASYTIEADSSHFVFWRYPYLPPLDWPWLHPRLPIFIDETIVSQQSFHVENEAFTWNLEPGWNLVSKPFLDGNIQSANEVAAIDGITQVARYDPEEKAFEFYIKDVPAQSVDFEIDNDVGYWVFAEANVTSIVTGDVPSQRQVNLTKGWNLLGWTSVYRLKASQLAFLDGDTSQFVNYNDQNQYEYYLTDLPAQSTDFTVEAGKGYWIHTEEPTILIYGG